ncbi:MAG: 23S rRNA (guanosine(2251)-2'-O)-methyltransferase RlmB [Lactobacillaceae bacterium]|jgi:23S rRNA (guanosine2251-2'-O)-methyltransferase|nr:23S rRNA (guanosine(2251)-2'-O)-methyltransferase RlmB [Lactobacillaceae bacterium]
MAKNNAPNRSGLIIYGRHAVMAALLNPKRQINKLLVTKENFNEVKDKAPQNFINIVDRKEIEKLLPQDAVHQGFAAYAKELESIAVEDIIKLAEGRERCHILVLDQVTDPQNIGAIIRSCAAFGTLALIVQDKNSPSETGAMAKASVGAIETLPICRATNLSRTIQQLQEAGFWAIGMDGSADTTIDKISKAGKNIIVMGSEGKGMRRLVEENCDIIVKLQISNKVESLNVSTAAAIALYEMNKE